MSCTRKCNDCCECLSPIPNGATCNDACANSQRCAALGIRVIYQTHCDWIPSRFKPTTNASPESVQMPTWDDVDAMARADAENRAEPRDPPHWYGAAVKESLSVEPPSGARELCPRCQCEMDETTESVVLNHIDQDVPRREHEKASDCNVALKRERDTLSDRLRVAEGLVKELKVADFALRERTGHLTALEDVHRQRYENMRTALGVTCTTAEQVVGAAIAAIHELTQLRTTNARLARAVERLQGGLHDILNKSGEYRIIEMAQNTLHTLAAGAE